MLLIVTLGQQLFKKNLNASKPFEHPPLGGKMSADVETKPLHGIKRVFKEKSETQCNHIGSTVVVVVVVIPYAVCVGTYLSIHC